MGNHNTVTGGNNVFAPNIGRMSGDIKSNTFQVSVPERVQQNPEIINHEHFEDAVQSLNAVRIKLVGKINVSTLKDLLDKLQQKKVFNSGEVELVRECKETTTEKVRCMVDMLLKKGPEACESFLRFLKETDEFLYKTLQL